MKIAVQTGGITGHFNFDLEKTLQTIKKCGFDAIDWNIPTGIDLRQIVEKDYSKNVFHKSMEEIKEHYAKHLKLIKDNEIEITQMHAPFPAHIPEADNLLEYMLEVYKKLIIFADYAGCKNLIIHGTCYRPDFPEQTEEFLDQLNRKMYEDLIPTLLETKVTVCLENLFTWQPGVPFEGPGHCSDPEKAIEIIDYLNQKAGKECFGLCFDTGHALLVGLDIKEYLIKLGHRIKALHIHDNDAVTDLHVAPYTGKLDWNSFTEGLKAINYKGDLSFETFGQVYNNRIPTEMLEPCLKLIAECGKYFKSKII